VTDRAPRVVLVQNQVAKDLVQHVSVYRRLFPLIESSCKRIATLHFSNETNILDNSKINRVGM
jgi:hypothetical protein